MIKRRHFLGLVGAGVAAPASARLFLNTLSGFNSGGGEPGFYGDLFDLGLTDGLKLCLDSGSALSYPGSGQTWYDRSGGGYDFFRGASSSATTDDPTFNGSAGSLSSSEYWSFDGGDFFDYDGGSNETWMSALHKDGAQYTILVWLYKNSGATDQVLVATLRGPSISVAGLRFGIGTALADKMSIDVRDDAGNVELQKTTDGTVSNAAWHLVGVSIDETASGFFYLDGSYNQVSAADTFTAAYTSPGTGTGDLMCIGSASTPNRQPLPNTTRMGGVMVWQGTALTKAQIDTIWNRQKTRYGL